MCWPKFQIIKIGWSVSPFSFNVSVSMNGLNYGPIPASPQQLVGLSVYYLVYDSLNNIVYETDPHLFCFQQWTSIYTFRTPMFSTSFRLMSVATCIVSLREKRSGRTVSDSYYSLSLSFPAELASVTCKQMLFCSVAKLFSLREPSLCLGTVLCFLRPSPFKSNCFIPISQMQVQKGKMLKIQSS